MPRLLLLMPSTTYRAPDFLAAAHRMEVEVVVGTNRKQTLADQAPQGNLTLAFRAPEEAVRQVQQFARRYPLDAVVGVDDDCSVLAAQASEALGLRSNPPEAVQAAADKARTRSLLARAGLPGPRFRCLPVDSDVDEAARQAPYPCVLKPTFLAASRGVIRADDPDAFAAAFRRISALLERPDVFVRGGPQARQILVESFVPGPEFALEGLLIGGDLQTLALFDKPDPLDGPYFEETLYITPSRRAAGDQERIVAAVREGAAALGLVEGPVHAEVRLPDSGPVVMEIAPRSIGGLCSRALRFGAGLSLEDVILQHALERQTVAPSRESAAAGVLMLPIPGAGVLREVAGLEEAREVDGVGDIDITVPVGQDVVPLPEGDRYLGFAFARGETPGAVEVTLRRVQSLLRFRIEPR